MINKNLLLSSAKSFDISLDDKQLELFDIYAQALSEKNKVMNLTAICEPDDIVIKHFADSLSVLTVIKPTSGQKLLDVGTGAGFPGTSLLIACPELDVTMLDGTRKKLDFVSEALDSIGLAANVVHARAEEAGQRAELRESFDYVTARAVASLRELCEYCLPFVKVGGTFIAMKGSDVSAEAGDAESAIRLLGGKITDIKTFDLFGCGERNLISVKKISQTPPKYPRPSAKIAKQPLR